jgi:hypothetical protein
MTAAGDVGAAPDELVEDFDPTDPRVVRDPYPVVKSLPVEW